jgi:hypothetical protein
MRVPAIEDLTSHHELLAAIVAKTSWLPHPKTVAHFNGAIFPTLRYKRGFERFAPVESNGTVIGMYDDNATPEWALFWSHGLTGVRSKGWTIAHVWPASDDIHAYTHLANLAMVPEALASLTDKNGPLTAFLRWHSWDVYGWRPQTVGDVAKPNGYDSVEWRYLAEVDDPKALIRQRFGDRNNERVRILKAIMEANDQL